jgi:hypothetical protein
MPCLDRRENGEGVPPFFPPSLYSASKGRGEKQRRRAEVSSGGPAGWECLVVRAAGIPCCSLGRGADDGVSRGTALGRTTLSHYLGGFFPRWTITPQWRAPDSFVVYDGWHSRAYFPTPFGYATHMSTSCLMCLPVPQFMVLAQGSMNTISSSSNAPRFSILRETSSLLQRLVAPCQPSDLITVGYGVSLH